MNEMLTILLGLFIFMLCLRAIRIVPEYERIVVLRLGRYAGTRGPGIMLVVPVMETTYTVDLRERLLEIPNQTAITRDNAPISIGLLVYYRVINPKMAILQVTDMVQAALNMAVTTLRSVVGDITLDGVLAQREGINDTMRLKLDDITERWGVKIMSVEIREIKPPPDIQEAMNRQMTAERDRRATVTKASGEGEACITVAEAHKRADILKAEGDREAQILRAQAFALSLQTINDDIQTLDPRTLILQYYEMLGKIGTSPSTKLVLPMDFAGSALQAEQLLHVPSANGRLEG